MRLISSMSWVKKGASQTPLKVRLEKEEMKSLFGELGGGRLNDNDDDEQSDHDEDDKSTNSNDSSSKSIERKYNMDNYDEEGYILST